MSTTKQHQFVIRVGPLNFMSGTLITWPCGLHQGYRIVDYIFTVLLIHFRPTLYIGEHAGGLYALPSLVEEGSPLVEVRSIRYLKKGKVCIQAKWPIRAAFILGFCGMKRLGLFLLPWMGC